MSLCCGFQLVVILPPRGHLVVSIGIFGCHNREGEVLLASSELK
jgi:hypothetical protein